MHNRHRYPQWTPNRLEIDCLRFLIESLFLTQRLRVCWYRWRALRSLREFVHFCVIGIIRFRLCVFLVALLTTDRPGAGSRILSTGAAVRAVAAGTGRPVGAAAPAGESPAVATASSSSSSMESTALSTQPLPESMNISVSLVAAVLPAASDPDLPVIPIPAVIVAGGLKSSATATLAPDPKSPLSIVSVPPSPSSVCDSSRPKKQMKNKKMKTRKIKQVCCREHKFVTFLVLACYFFVCTSGVPW